MQSVMIGKAAAFANPGRKVVDVEGVAVGVFCRDGRFTAFENVCPHMGGPVCQGKIIPRVSLHCRIGCRQPPTLEFYKWFRIRTSITRYTVVRSRKRRPID